MHLTEEVWVGWREGSVEEHALCLHRPKVASQPLSADWNFWCIWAQAPVLICTYLHIDTHMHTQTHMCIHTLEKQICETQSSLRLSHVCIKNNSRFCHSEKLHSAVGSSSSRPCGESGAIECSALSGTVYPAPRWRTEHQRQKGMKVAEGLWGEERDSRSRK